MYGGAHRALQDGTRSLQRNENLPSCGLMSSASSSRDTWLSLIAKLQHSLKDRSEQTPASNEVRFREEFTRICKLHKEHRRHKLLNGILLQHHPILNLTQTVDEAQRTDSALTALVWGILHIVTQVSMSIESIILLYGHLISSRHRSQPDTSSLNSSLPLLP